MIMNDLTEHIKQQTAGLNPVEALRKLADAFQGEIIFSTSFGWEDQVITHMIFANKLPIKVFTLEMGRLLHETYYVWNRTLEMYGEHIHAYYPQNELLQQMVSTKGPNSFYESVDNRKECCYIRKIEPFRCKSDKGSYSALAQCCFYAWRNKGGHQGGYPSRKGAHNQRG